MKTILSPRQRIYNLRSPLWMVRDVPRSSEHSPEILKVYTENIYELLLRRLSDMKGNPAPSEEDIRRTINLFNEFIKIKRILAGEDVNVR